MSEKLENGYQIETPGFDLILYLEELNAVEVFNNISSPKEEKSADIFEHGNFLVKTLNPAICEWTAILVKQSFLSGNFPETLKLSKKFLYTKREKQ